MRRKDDTLRDTLLVYARSLADNEGVGAINIRALAQMAGVATGTVYNYFSNKDDILLALTEEYWKMTLLELNTAINAISLCDQLVQIFDFLKMRIDSSASKLMNSLGNVASAGQQRMSSMQSSLQKIIIRGMENDVNIRKEIWNDVFTKEKYAHFIVKNLVMLLREKSSDIQFLITIVKRTIY